MSNEREMYTYINRHPKVIEAKKIAKAEFLARPSSSVTCFKIPKGETDNFVVIEDYTKAGAVLTSRQGKIDGEIIESIRTAIHPRQISSSMLKVVEGGPLSNTRFPGYTVSKKTLPILLETLDTLEIAYTKSSRSDFADTFFGVVKEKPDDFFAPDEQLISHEELMEEAASLQPIPSPPIPSSSSSASQNTASVDPKYGNHIMTGEKYQHLDLVVVKLAPFGTRIVGVQNRTVKPVPSDPLMTVKPLTTAIVKSIRKVSPTLPILDKSMITMVKDAKIKASLTKLYAS